jgi:hypothetical protein
MVDAVDTYHTAYTRRQQQWKKVRDCLDGEDDVKGAGESYLPKPSGMSLTNYAAYKTRSSFYGVAERTLRGLTGLVFRREPSAVLPPKLAPMLDNMTTDGYSFKVLCQEIADEILSMGRYGLLLDFARDSNVNSLPHVATYKAEDIRNWSLSYRNGRKILMNVILVDDIENEGLDDDPKRCLELALIDDVYTVREWTIDGAAKNSAWVMNDSWTPMIGGKTLNYIPFFFINPYDLKPDIEKPPFLDMCNLNIDHYQNSADYEHALYMTAQPTPYVSGNMSADERPKSIGAGTIWYLPEGATAGMVEFSGQGIKAQREAMLDKEDRMAALGARMIAENSKSAETAETTRLRGRSEMSLLLSACSMIEAALTEVFRLSALWIGSNPDEVDVTINKDFIETRLTPQDMDALVRSWMAGAISRDTLHENLQKGEIVPGSRTKDEEKQLIDDEAEALAETTIDTGAQPPIEEPEEEEPENGA